MDTWLIIVIVCGALIFVIAIVAIVFCLKKRKAQKGLVQINTT